ncbi:aliphatic sulfonate ABC transporter substrate-binding protein [Oceanobacillus neutriphilus]|uniref:Sulfonate ABC transporter substrate-binding protein n=1 Tax=Oceanobacillus neutriphilus TaxID=531815 RepID=A0ABQ2NXF8_9BACI|nr:aliphatic sulfonate ABC transporter substrate-binding protein [Oceanobacillus neutriphilus]GGP12985.1 sulfonate ABC transporter substrate-binding protein [Oceanobacillus neutriphilus]
MNHHKNRHILILFLITMLSLILAACGSSASGAKGEVNIGYQKGGPTLALKNSGEFQEELEELGYTVTWSEFNTGSSILEALNAGSIDLANAGDIPSIFALDKGSDFQYIASEPSAPETEGILVSEDSSIQSLEDLKGKRVAYNNASIAQYLLIKLLGSADLSMDDIETVNLNPPDASLAFEKGEIDVWVVWDPYFADAEARGNRILHTAENIVPYRSFYFATTEFIDQDPEVVELYVKHLAKVGKEINEDPSEASELLEGETQIPAATWETVLNKKESDAQFMDDQAIEDLEIEAADLLDIGLIENEINFSDYIWNPDSE